MGLLQMASKAKQPDFTAAAAKRSAQALRTFSKGSGAEADPGPQKVLENFLG